jgi:hypothetical protein
MCATRGPPYAGAEQCREEVLVAVAALVPDRPVVALKPAWAAVVGDADNQRPAVRVEEAGDGLTTASSIAASRCFVWRLSRAVDLNSTLRFSPAAMSSAVGTLDGPALSPLPVTSLGGSSNAAATTSSSGCSATPTGYSRPHDFSKTAFAYVEVRHGLRAYSIAP